MTEVQISHGHKNSWGLCGSTNVRTLYIASWNVEAQCSAEVSNPQAGREGWAPGCYRRSIAGSTDGADAPGEETPYHTTRV